MYQPSFHEKEDRTELFCYKWLLEQELSTASKYSHSVQNCTSCPMIDMTLHNKTDKLV